jgi:Uma2 family endonuclease
MEPASTRRLLTAEEFYYEQPDHLRTELIAGEMVLEPLPKPLHGRLAARIAHLLQTFTDAHPTGEVLGEAGFVLERGPDTVRGPDVSFVSEERYRASLESGIFFEGAPDLAIEVASPSDSRRHLGDKARNFLDAGSRLVWVVWPKRRTVDVHRPGAPVETLGESATLDGEAVLPGFRLPVAKIFERVFN